MKNSKYFYITAFGLSFALVFVLFVLQGHAGFSLWDEGFLWYGAQRVMLGDVPTRDFIAYEPGRYYWSAGIMSLLGSNGIISLRIAVAIFQVFGLFTGLLIISKTIWKQRDHIPYLLLSGLTLVIWMFPRHKLFDASLSIFLVGILAFLIENPTARRHFIVGCCVGGIAVFGRNHGVYGAVGSLGALVWLYFERAKTPGLVKGFFYWANGVVAGFTPMLLMGLFVPGFAKAFLENTLSIFEQKATNLPLPVPWPWTVDFAAPTGNVVQDVLVGLFFLAVLGFGPLSIGWVLYQKFRKQASSPALVAAAILALPYAQYAFSRADIGHLALGIFPLLLGLLVFFANQPTKLKWLFAVVLCAGSVWVMYAFQPGWYCFASRQCVNVEVSGSTLQVDRPIADEIALLRQLSEQYAPNGESFIAAPFWPGAYALLERQAPTWEIYALIPRSEAFEEKEIKRIKASNPAFVIILDIPLDGREELRFKNTHPLTYQYILDNFEVVPYSSNPAYQILISRNGGQ